MTIWRPDRTFYPSPRMAELGWPNLAGLTPKGRGFQIAGYRAATLLRNDILGHS